MKCTIIQDLLPLYCDGLTSDDSNEAIVQHLQECRECREMYTQMKKKENAALSTTERDIKPLQKIKRRSILKMIAGFISGVVLLGTLFAFMFIGIVPAKSSDVNISYQTELVSAENGEDHLEIRFLLETDDGRVLGMRVKDMLCMGETEESSYTRTEIRPYRTFQIPFTSQWGKDSTNTNSINFNDTHHDFNENDVVHVQFRDRDVTFNLGEIAAEWHAAQEQK